MFVDLWPSRVPFRDYNGDKIQYIVSDDQGIWDVVVGRQISPLLEMINAVITIYEKKQLPVAPNLALAISSVARRWSMTVPDVIRMCEVSYIVGNDLFAKYKDDVEKYLLLLP